MQVVVGVRFKKAGKIYYFDPGQIVLSPGDHVIVETARGLEYGEVVSGPKEVNPEDIVSPLKPVIRKATPEDQAKVQEYDEKRKYAFDVCVRQIAARELPMKLVDVEYTFDGSKVIFYFTAEGRVDFRELVKDLASILKMRIELRQIGVRDRAKMLGGLGPCGRPLCCATFLGDFEPVSIRMAKDQALSLNPTKISGTCGRLMCCLKFESDFYKEARSYLPAVGKEISTPEGKGKVVEVNALKGKFKVELEDGRTIEMSSCGAPPESETPLLSSAAISEPEEEGQPEEELQEARESQEGESEEEELEEEELEGGGLEGGTPEEEKPAEEKLPEAMESPEARGSAESPEGTEEGIEEEDDSGSEAGSESQPVAGGNGVREGSVPKRGGGRRNNRMRRRYPRRPRRSNWPLRRGGGQDGGGTSDTSR